MQFHIQSQKDLSLCIHPAWHAVLYAVDGLYGNTCAFGQFRFAKHFVFAELPKIVDYHNYYSLCVLNESAHMYLSYL